MKCMYDDVIIQYDKEMTTPSSLYPEVPNGKSHTVKEVHQFIHTSCKGYPALMFDDSIVSQQAALFVLTLVRKFLLRHLNLDVIHNFFINLKLSDLSILACQLRLLKWTPDFNVCEESLITPVWISFPIEDLLTDHDKVLSTLVTTEDIGCRTQGNVVVTRKPTTSQIEPSSLNGVDPLTNQNVKINLGANLPCASHNLEEQMLAIIPNLNNVPSTSSNPYATNLNLFDMEVVLLDATCTNVL
ncbi:hypothetical protein IEQ34_007431 [Dendrobium chrysotoxum]|uniref:DUF4283 domain-containing protein n=1 Tax=Dendrobium chrysotoxum TaxID=161865 RepID=A0AAV7HAV2_DENCH|nr:hypothetical protein IEQ34_007431 [Dendrobium chrysotoxum]